VAATCGNPPVFKSLAEMASVRPQVIHILTPPAFHCQLTLEALSLGCHVFVEKPMAETAEECDRMAAKAKEAGRILSVNHSARMDPIVLRALELVKQGAIGDVLAVDFFRSSDYPAYPGGPMPAPHRYGAYPFQDLGVHGLYLLEAFLGKILTLDVRYFSTGRDQSLFFDEWRGLAVCEKGTGQMYLSWVARPMQNDLVIHGTRGEMRVDCFLQTCLVRKKLPAPRLIQNVMGAMQNGCSTLVRVPWNVMRLATGRLLPSPGIHASVGAFYDALERGEQPPVSADEGRRMVAWMDTVSRQANADKDRRLGVGLPVPPARILVTGATGFLGRALLERLRKRGEPIRVLVRRPSRALEADPLVHQVCGDLGDPETVDRAVRGVDVVYHVGAAMRGGSADFERGTVWGTKNVVAACVKHGVKRMVHVSSMTVLHHASHAKGEVVSESWQLEPSAELRGAYTQTKLEAERVVLSAVVDHGLPAVIVRPGQIFGAGAEKVAPAGTIAVAGRWIVVGSGNLPVPLVYIEDVVDALLMAAERLVAFGSIFHVADTEAVTQNEYLQYCQQASDGTLRISRVPKSILWMAAVAAETLGRVLGRKVPLSRYRLSSATPLGPCDCSAAASQLGWTPRIGTRQGIREVFGGATPKNDSTPVLVR
jgi:nucleoside-diphosphate-sugar epimerase/predicted dehydrogenase